MSKGQPKRQGVNTFTIGVIVAAVIVGAICTAILHYLDGGIFGWEWLFMGVVTIILAIVGGLYILAFWNFVPDVQRPRR